MQPLPASGLSRLFSKAALPRLILLRAVWPNVVGHDVAGRTELVAMEGDILRVRVPDARWQKVLHRMQRQILGRLRDAVGDAAPRRLGFQEGPVKQAPPPITAVPARAPSDSPAPSIVVEGAAAIADPETRQRFLATAARYLSRGAPLPVAAGSSEEAATSPAPAWRR